MNLDLKCLLLLPFFLAGSMVVRSQGWEKINPSQSKPAVNILDLKNWSGVTGGTISSDGKYAYYSVYHNSSAAQRLIVKSTLSEWEYEFKNASMQAFTGDNKFIVVKTMGDSLNILPVGTDKTLIMPNVKDVQVVPGPNSWVLCRTSKSEFVALDVRTGKSIRFDSVLKFYLSPGGQLVLLAQNDSLQNALTLRLVKMQNQSGTVIWTSRDSNCEIQNVAFDDRGNQIAVLFIDKRQPEDKKYSLWYYDVTNSTGQNILSEFPVHQLATDLCVSSSVPRFSKDGKKIFIGLNEKEVRAPKTRIPQLDIWNYKDSVLQSQQLEDVTKKRVYQGMVTVPEKYVVRIEGFSEKIVAESGDYILLERTLGLHGVFESSWNKAAQIAYYIYSLTDRTKSLLRDGIVNPAERFSLSPNGKWAIYYDFAQRNYFSYETATGEIRNLTKECLNVWEDEDNDYPEPRLPTYPIWLKGDTAFFVYDSYDIWLIDPTGKAKPHNWTNGIGRRNKIRFLLVDKPGTVNRYKLGEKDNIYLNAFNKEDKSCGYYEKRLNSTGEPKLLTMGPYLYGGTDISFGIKSQLIKAAEGRIYLGLRCSASEAPNYFVTRDFKTFKFISDIKPQRQYNWYTVELHSWKSEDSSLLKGILYKPENFDSSRKYPIIFVYYERRSDELNLFISPKASTGEINIPAFVSKGYLVFVPDIESTLGKPGDGAYKTVMSAANYLSKNTWVDSKKMGLQGHSFGGFETGYILTRTDVFAAACSAAGVYDLISLYGSAARAGYPMYHAERNQGKLGATPWCRKDLYIENSAVFNADKVSTPLLMMHNKGDRVVPFSQGVEFFTSLRRLGKKVWMLQYDGEGHSLEPFESAALDFHTRVLQFFDHYLKGAEAPKWMTNGVPAKMKGIDDGFGVGR